MSNTLKLGNGKWATGKDTLLSFSDTNNNYKPLPFSFSRASSGTVINKAGLIETVGSGEPRIDFKDNTKGSLLLEPTRSNLVKSSGDISTQSTYWMSNQGGTSVQNATIAPDGSSTASQINTFGQQYSGITQGSISVSNTEYTYSIYLKAKNGTQNIRLIFFDGATFHSSDFTISSEWKRYDYKFTPVAGTFQIYITCPYANASFYTWGVQLEQGSYATSYIPTSGSAVTRVAETTSQTLPDGVIGQTEGTVFLDTKMALQSINNYQLFSINNGGGSDRIRVLTATGNRLRFIYQLDGGIVAYNFYNPIDYGSLTSLKIAFTYKSGDIKVYINGVLVDSSTNTFTIAEKLINIDIASSAGGYSQMFFNDVKIYNTALTDQELIALTS